MKDNCILFEIIQIYLWKKSRVTIYVLHDLFIAPVISFRCNKYWENNNKPTQTQITTTRKIVLKWITLEKMWSK